MRNVFRLAAFGLCISLSAHAENFTLDSPDITAMKTIANKHVFNGFGCAADLHGLPLGAGDPAAGKAPKSAIQMRTDFGKPGWGGPCPPKGDKPHRYIFTVHALKVDKLDVPEDATAALVGFMINANRIGKASFTGVYGRK